MIYNKIWFVKGLYFYRYIEGYVHRLPIEMNAGSIWPFPQYDNAGGAASDTI